MKKKLLALLLICSLALPPTAVYGTTVPDNGTEFWQETEEEPEYPLTYQDIEEEVPDITGILYDETENDTVPYYMEVQTAEQLPAAYRADEDGCMPAFRDQKSFGVCWAFSALAACETNMMKKGLAGEDVDLSESHLAYYFYNKDEGLSDMLHNMAGDYNRNMKNNYLNIGGNGAFTMWHLAGWHGPAGEADEEYDFTYQTLLDNKIKDETNNNSTSTHVLPQETEVVYGRDVAHVQNVFIVNSRDREAMKHVILEQGSVATGYCSANIYDNFAQKKYSYREDGELDEGNYFCNEERGTNHAIQIIGWDDNYDRSLFWTEPEENGAWLIRNSWGEESDKNAQYGLFWMSYEDLSLGKTAFAYDMEAVDNYDNIYQYDGASGTWTQQNYQVANVFTGCANGLYDEVISAVSIGIFGTNVDYTAKIYLYPEDFDWNTLTEDENCRLDEGWMATSQSGTFGYSGYHTVELAEPVVVSAGQKYAVVFEFPVLTNVYFDKTYENGGWISFTTENREGQSYRRNWQGSSKTGFAEASGTENLVYRIKAFTDNAATKATIILEGEKTVREGQTDTLACRLVDMSGEIVWTSSDEEIVSVQAGKITGRKAGQAVITASCNGRNSSCQVTVLPPAETPANPPISSDEKSKPIIGSVYEVGTNKYEILSDTTASCKGSVLKKNKVKKVTIPASVEIDGRVYQVTKIDQKAFYNCKNLKKVIIQSKSLKSVGANAFKKIHKNAVINVPKGKKTKYKKLLKNKCDKSTVIK